MKGISPIIATILLLLIVIAVVSFTFTFFQGLTQTSSSAAQTQLGTTTGQLVSFSIENVDAEAGTITLRNKGTGLLDNLNVYVDDEPVGADYLPIPGDGIGSVILSSAMEPGEHTVKVTSAFTQDSYTVSVPVTWSFEWSLDGS